MARILIIEDDPDLRYSLVRTLSKRGHDIAEATNEPDGLEHAQSFDPALILSDINLAAGSGLSVLAKLRERGCDAPVILMTAFASVGSAVEAMKLGADDYLTKPFNLDELVLTVDRHLRNREQRSRLQLYERLDAQSRGPKAPGESMIGQSPIWKSVVELADRLARLPLPVDPGKAGTAARPAGSALPCILILGPTGTGKGVVARYLHERACEAATAVTPPPPFVHVNCSALAPSLIEAELFGHEKGAFTDAKGHRSGLFELAEGGTIFLDEIGEMPLELQAKILTIVEDGTYRRVGGGSERRVRARLIAATNQDLQARARAGTFRSDLYYRLNAFTLQLPPLKDRDGDVLLLARALLDQFASEYGRRGLALSPDAASLLARHDWPGNVRELVNVMQRAAMLSPAPSITPSDLAIIASELPHATPTATPSLATAATRPPSPEARSLAEHVAGPAPLVFDFEHGTHAARDVERELILQALAHTRGNVSRAARLIGMQRSSFRKRLERFREDGVTIPDFGAEVPR